MSRAKSKSQRKNKEMVAYWASLAAWGCAVAQNPKHVKAARRRYACRQDELRARRWAELAPLRELEQMLLPCQAPGMASE